MFRTVVAGLIAVPLMVSSASATDFLMNMQVGTDATAISNALKALGIEIREIGADESGIELEIAFADEIYDLDVDPETGIITNIEVDLDDDGDV